MPLTTYTSGEVLTAASLNANLSFAASNPASGLTFISATNFTSVTSVSLATNTFSATFRNYKIIFQVATTGANVITLRTRTAGTDNTGSDYFQASSGVTSAAAADNVGENSVSAITVFNLTLANSRVSSMSFDVISPVQSATVGTNFLGTVTAIIGGTGRIGRSFVGAYTGANAVDSLSFISSTITDMTGVVRVYGYSES